MKTHNSIESNFRKVINENSDYFMQEAEKSREKIWQQLDQKKERKPALIWLWTLAAACLLLFITTTVVIISKMDTDKMLTELAELNFDLQNQLTSAQEINTSPNKPAVAQQASEPDTVYLEKIITVIKPLVKTKLITDTLYVDRVIYFEKEKPQDLIAVSEKPAISKEVADFTSTDSQENKILIRNSSTQKQKKRKKLQLKFGGNKKQSNKKSLAITAEF